MPYESAYEVLKRCTSTIPECVEVIEQLGIQYGYITATVAIGTRRNADTELIRIKVLSAALKYRISELSQSHQI